MQIVVVGNRFPWPLRDGGAQATYGTLQALVKAGVSVHYFSFNTEKHWVEEEVLRERFGFLSYQAVPKKSTPTAIGACKNLFTGKSYHVERYYDKAGSDTLKNLLQELDNPVVWVEGLYSIPLVEPLLPWLKEQKISLVYRSHNVEYQIWERVARASGNPFKKWYLGLQSVRLRKYEEHAWGWFDVLLPITADDQRVQEDVLVFKSHASLSVSHNAKIQLYQPGFSNLERRIEGIRKQLEEGDLSILENRCFHIGSMEWEANKQSILWFIQECWPLILEKNPLAEFHLAGKGLVADDPKYSGTGVIVHGEVDNSEEFMMQNGISVVPLLSGSGIRMKILEAMLYGCPVVTTSIGMQGLAVNPGVELQFADGPKGFAEKVLALMGDVQMKIHQRNLSWDFLLKFHNESENIQRVLRVLAGE